MWLCRDPGRGAIGLGRNDFGLRFFHQEQQFAAGIDHGHTLAFEEVLFAGWLPIWNAPLVDGFARLLYELRRRR